MEYPDDTVREALLPVVGDKTLRELAMSNERAFQTRVGTVAGVVVFQPLPADAAAPVGRAFRPLQQHRTA
jgi:hypothetical protein